MDAWSWSEEWVSWSFLLVSGFIESYYKAGLLPVFVFMSTLTVYDNSVNIKMRSM